MLHALLIYFTHIASLDRLSWQPRDSGANCRLASQTFVIRIREASPQCIGRSPHKIVANGDISLAQNIPKMLLRPGRDWGSSERSHTS